jgi:hypothetical protein
MDRSALQDYADPSSLEYAENTGGYNRTMSPSANSILNSQRFDYMGSSAQAFGGIRGDSMDGVPNASPIPSSAILSPRQYMDRAPMAVTTPAATPQPTKFTSRKAYLLGFPEHAYILPAGPALNFTLADILVILPNWFKNQQMTARFINNGLVANVHVAMLQEHRTMNLSDAELTRLRDGCSDQYRRTMRQITFGWKKANHKAPVDWNRQNIAVNQFLPDAARNTGYTAPPSIPFKALMSGIKKLPQGPDAGDLTRALEFALQNQKPGHDGRMEEFVFPDDIHAILNHIGYTAITMDHFDVAAILRCDRKIKEAAANDRQRRRELEAAGLAAPLVKRSHRANPKTPERPPVRANIADLVSSPFWKYNAPQIHQVPSPQPSAVYGYQPPDGYHAAMLPPQTQLISPIPPNWHHHDIPHTNGYLQSRGTSMEPGVDQRVAFAYSGPPATANAPPQNLDAPAANGNGYMVRMAADGFPKIPDVCRMPPDIEAGIEASLNPKQSQGAEELFSFNTAEIDALIAQHLDYDISGLLTPFPESNFDATTRYKPHSYPPTQPLRECVEADDKEDFSALARAARWCRDPNNFSLEYRVGDLGLVVALQGMME